MFRPGGLEAKITSTCIRTARRQSNVPSIFHGLNPLQLKPSFASLDRVSLVPLADFWVRSGPAVSVALAGSAGFQASAPNQASADRYVGGSDFLDLTFYFSFAGFLLLVSCCNRINPDFGV